MYSSAALEGGNVYDTTYVDEVICTNTSGGTLYLQLFLGVSALPADTAVPDICIAVPAESSVHYDPRGTRWAVSGIAFCLSSTSATKTIAGSVGFFSAR